MGQELRIASDRAVRLASEFAELSGETVEEAVEHALSDALERKMAAKSEPIGHNNPPSDEDIEERLRKLRLITAEIRRYMAEPGLTSDHSWLYDEDGLPR